MHKLTYILTFLLFFVTACSVDSEYIESANEFVTIKVPQSAFVGKAVDADNLESEQTIKNISIFLTNPNAEEFYYSAIRNVNYTDEGDYRLVHLPLPLASLGHKDIYVVTNLENSALSQVKNLTELKRMSTPVASKNNNLDPQKGICMYGKTLNFNFNNESKSPAIVDAVRTCAKYNIKLTFPENPLLSSKNAFIILGAATHTTIGDEVGVPASNGYFDYSVPIMLSDNGSGAYTNVTYVYEAEKAPRMGIYLNYNGNASVAPAYIVTLPVPQRNYMYDINVEIYDSVIRTTSHSF